MKAMRAQGKAVQPGGFGILGTDMTNGSAIFWGAGWPWARFLTWQASAVPWRLSEYTPPKRNTRTTSNWFLEALSTLTNIQDVLCKRRH